MQMSWGVPLPDSNLCLYQNIFLQLLDPRPWNFQCFTSIFAFLVTPVAPLQSQMISHTPKSMWTTTITYCFNLAVLSKITSCLLVPMVIFSVQQHLISPFLP